MRMLLKFTIPMETGNRLTRTGKLGATIHAIMDELKPEAAYFIEEHGERTGIVVVNFDDMSQMPAMVEPLFLGLNAKVEVHPALTAADLAKAGVAIQQAAQKYPG